MVAFLLPLQLAAPPLHTLPRPHHRPPVAIAMASASSSTADSANPIVVRAPSLPFTGLIRFFSPFLPFLFTAHRPARVPAVDFVVCSWAAAPRPWTIWPRSPPSPTPTKRSAALPSRCREGAIRATPSLQLHASASAPGSFPRSPVYPSSFPIYY